MKISKFLVPVLGLPVLLGTGTTLVSCNKNKNSFVTDPWAVVVFHANRGLEHLKEWYGLDSFIGLERTIKVYGIEHKVKVVGENEDYIVDETNNKPLLSRPAALTFQFSNVLTAINERHEITPVKLNFGEVQSFCNWSLSNARSFLVSNKYPNPLIDEIEQQLGENSIKTVSKKTLSSPRLANFAPETIFLPSLADIFNVDQISEIDDEYCLEAEIEPGVYREPYSYYRQTIDQNDLRAPKHKQRVLALTDTDGFAEPYWLRTSLLSKQQPYNTFYVASDGASWDHDVNSKLFGLAPMFCI